MALADNVISFPLPKTPAGFKPESRATPRRYVSDADVDKLKEYMLRTHAGRDRDMHVLVNAYHGNFYRNTDQNWNLDRAGHLLLRVSDHDTSAAPTVGNLLKGFVDDYTSMLSELPSVQVPAIRQQFPDDAALYAWKERMERIAYGFWAASNMEMRQIEAAWWDPTCGSHGAVVLPDFERGHAVIQFTAPWTTYGIPKQGDPFSLTRMMVIAHEDPYRVEDQFPGSVPSDAFDLLNEEDDAVISPENTRSGVEHVIYLDEEWFIRKIAGKTRARVFHGLGFCPGAIVPFILLPEYTRGHSAIEQAVPLQLSANYALSMWEEALKDEIFKTLYVIDPQNVPENFQRGTGQIITVNPGGAVGEFGGSSGALKTVAGHVELLQRLMEHSTGVSRARTEGRLASGGPTTGRGIERSQGPQMERVATLQRTQGFYMAKLLRYACLMTADHKMWESTADEEVEFTGQMRGTPFSEKITRAELARPEFVMQYSPLAGLSLPERVNIGLQLYHADPPLLSWYQMAELHALVRDVPELRRQIEEDLKWRSDIIRERMAAETGQPAASASPQNAEAAAATLNAGASNKETLRRVGMALPTPSGQGAPAPTVAGAAAAVASGGQPPAPAATGGGGPGGPGAPGPAPDAMAQALAEPPAAPVRIPSGLEGTRSLDEDVRAVLSTLSLRGEVYLVGNRLYVLDWKDVDAVRKAIKGIPNVTARAAGKKIPDGAILVSTAAPRAAG